MRPPLSQVACVALVQLSNLQPSQSCLHPTTSDNTRVYPLRLPPQAMNRKTLGIWRCAWSLGGARSVHGRAGHIGYDCSFPCACISASIPRWLCCIYPLWLFVSARSMAVDPAREDVDGFDAPGNLVMSVGLHLASLDVSSFTAQIEKIMEDMFGGVREMCCVWLMRVFPFL